MQILIAEDDRSLGSFLSSGLRSQGYEVRWEPDGVSALEAFLEILPDLTILDLNLPRMDGTDVLRHLRAADQERAVLVLTARSEVDLKVRCLDAGADDCMTKPFSLQELRARCRALLRRRREVNLVLRAATLELNRMEHAVYLEGRALEMTNKEFALLEYLMLRRGQCVTRASLLRELWKMDPASGTNVVDVYINYLRRKLGSSSVASAIETVRGQGYRFAASLPLLPTLEEKEPCALNY